MSIPTMQLCLWKNVRNPLVLLAVAALVGACSGGDTVEDASSGATDLEVADADSQIHQDVQHQDADVKDAQDIQGSDEILADVDATDVIDLTDGDAEIPDGSDSETSVGDDDAISVGDDGDTTPPPDVPDTDTGPVSKCEFDPFPAAGSPGAACTDNGECDSGFCVDTPNGKVCTRACADICCPNGWGCVNLNSQGAEPFYGCTPKLVHACDPCTDDSQCASPGDKDGLCLPYGDVGSFCGGSCTKDPDCPSGYFCQAGSQGTKNGVSWPAQSKQCMKINGQCECSKAAKGQGLTTTCLSTNKYGKCSGARQCQLSGLTGCDAKAPTAEVCNGLDDDCNGSTDEPGAAMCTVFWKDSDKDGYGNSPGTGGDNQCLCKATELYTSISPSDCNDANPNVNPSVLEVCDGIDNDCNGKTDETCDVDKDGYCAADAVILPGNKSCKYKGVDCDDGNAKIHPGQPEICGNGIDDDCDGQTDSGANDPNNPAVGCSLYYEDGDKDGVGTFNSQCLCAPAGIFTGTASGDCNDSNKDVYPGAKELCGNGIDDNCNGKQDEAGAVNCKNFYKDGDSDGYGDDSLGSKPACLCAPSAVYTTAKGGDCNDSDPKMNPSMTEVCNNIDDDCDGQTDNNNALGCTTFYADYDKDGFGDEKKKLCLCSPIDKWTATIGGDCDDSKNAVSPVAPEICDSLDNDCNGIIDDANAQGCVMAFKDADGDGFGDPGTKTCVCGLAMPYNTFKGDDCNDKLGVVYPGAQEKCNGIDDNCDGVTDEANALGCTVYYADSDNDGVGNSAKAACLCAKGGIYTSTKSGDCNDQDPVIRPGNAESCDQKDNDCDGIVDNEGAVGCVQYYMDADKDGFGDVKTLSKCLCTASGFFNVLQSGDCDDSDKNFNPNAPEICDNKDNNCDGLVDPVGSLGCANYFPDIDNDGYGDMYASSAACQCGPLYPNTSPANLAKDCNDKNPLVSPGAFEVCGNSLDDNCNGVTDESTSNITFYIDNDGDGYGAGQGISTACKPGIYNGQYYSVTINGDCNDALKDVHPNATEVCNNIDDDCNGKTDEQLASVMCGDAANGTPACIGGKCLPQCYPGWFDADAIASDGCECKADSLYGVAGMSPTSPIELGYLYDDGGVKFTRSGNIMPGEDGDWYHFKAVDGSDASGSCDPFDVEVRFENNPDGNFVVDFYKHTAGSTSLLCGNETQTGWTVSYSGKSPSGPQISTIKFTGGDPACKNKDGSSCYDAPPVPEGGGECNCVNATTGSGGLPGLNFCKDNSDDFYVRVGRYPGKGTICQSYTIVITNGKVN